MNSLPKTVTGQRLGCDLNPGPTAPEHAIHYRVTTIPAERAKNRMTRSGAWSGRLRSGSEAEAMSGSHGNRMSGDPIFLRSRSAHML